MFLGHFGVGLAAKRAAPRVSLGTFFLAVQLADLLFWVLALFGVEHFRVAPGLMAASQFEFYDYPLSHSLLALAGWGLLLGAVLLLLRRGNRAALIVAACVVSHWVLDFIMHRPDMPVLPRGPYLGLGLWNSMPATVAIEVAFYAAGVGIYLKATTARDRTGSYALWALLALLAAIWAASLFAPPPSSEKPVVLSGVAMWLFVPWGYWIDRHRSTAVMQPAI